MGEATVSATSLVGRDRELALLRARLDAAREGQGSAVVLRGEPGVGKTALIEGLVGEAGDALVLRCRGVEAEVELPFSGLHELLGPLRDGISTLPGDLRASLTSALAMHSEEPASVVNASIAALTVLAEAAARQPLLVVVDDIHWIDEPTLLALTFIARRLSHDRLLLVAAARPGLAGSELPGERVDVEPLRLEAATTLTERLVGRPVTSATAAAVMSGTGGNPLAVIEAVRLLGDDLDRWGSAVDEPPPPGELIERGFANRLDGIEPLVAQALLVVATSLDDTAETWQSAFAALSIPADALDRAADAGLVAHGPGTVVFSHPLLRSLVFHRASLAERRRCHAALASATTDPGMRAWHAAAAVPLTDEPRAAALASAAEDFERRGGVLTAARALERAARITPDALVRAQRLVQAATTARSAGQSAWSIALYEEAHAAAAGDRTLQLKIEINRAALNATARSNADLLATCRALADEALQLDRVLASDALGLLAEEAVIVGAPDAARRALRELEALGPVDDDEIQLVSDLTIASVRCHLGDEPEAMLAGIDAFVRRATDAPETVTPAFSEALTWFEHHHLADAVTSAASRRARERGDLQLLLQAEWADGYRKLHRGEWAAADVALEDSQLIADAGGFSWYDAMTTSTRAILHGSQGRESALGLADHVDRLAAANSYTFAHLTGFARGAYALAQGHPELALEPLRACAAWHRRAEHNEPCAYSWPVDLVEAELATGHRAEAETALGWFTERVEARDRRGGRLAVHRLRGMLADDDAFAEHFEAAIRGHAEDPSPYELARTHLHYGRRLAATGDAAAATTQFDAARKLFAQLGAEGWVAQVDRALAAAGSAGSNGAPVSLLTSQEQVVADCVARGMTNKEAAAHLFLTTKTIEWHLRQIYRKLGIKSRVQLAQHVAAASSPNAATPELAG